MSGVWGRAGRVAVAALVVSAAVVADAAAQTILPWRERGFVAVNFGSQPKARTSEATGEFDLYEEKATFGSTIGVSGSKVIDVSGGVRVWKNLALGVGFSSYSDNTSAAVSMSIPDPLLFDTPTAASATVGDLGHSERGVHVSAIWMLPLTDKLDVAVFGGPSFYSLTKDIVTGFAVQQNTTTVSSIANAEVSGSGTGGHFGFDVSYRIVKNLAAGLLVRYGSASVDVSEVTGGKVDVGGLNFGAGVRFRF